MSDGRIRTVLRQMAWERAKAELASMLTTYYFELFDEEVGQYDELNDAINEFIRKVEVEVGL